MQLCLILSLRLLKSQECIQGNVQLDLDLKFFATAKYYLLNYIILFKMQISSFRNLPEFNWVSILEITSVLTEFFTSRSPNRKSNQGPCR